MKDRGNATTQRLAKARAQQIFSIQKKNLQKR
jgi:hypothetical protein